MADTTEYARDNQGFLLLGLDGLPLPQYDSINYDGWQYEYHPVTEEETAALLYLMDTAAAIQSRAGVYLKENRQG